MQASYPSALQLIHLVLMYHPSHREVSLNTRDVLRWYAGPSGPDLTRTFTLFAPLVRAFECFAANERALEPYSHADLSTRFDALSHPDNDAERLLQVLHELAPGGVRVGFKEVNFLVELVRHRVRAFLLSQGSSLELSEHHHAFGSGGDYCKTSHATTPACLVAASVIPICKTGTSQVTSKHGSEQTATQLGCAFESYDHTLVNQKLATAGFSYLPLSTLGFPYSAKLTQARRDLWLENVERVRQNMSMNGGFGEALQNTPVTIDILKIISPNAQVLGPRFHTTGVSHVSMIPYVLGAYLHLGSEGLIVHSYDGIDELSNASEGTGANNVVIEVKRDHITIAEFGPEDVGLRRNGLDSIGELDSPHEEAAAARAIIEGREHGPRRDFIALNTAAIFVAGQRSRVQNTSLVSRLKRALHYAFDLIDSGQAARTLELSQTTL